MRGAERRHDVLDRNIVVALQSTSESAGYAEPIRRGVGLGGRRARSTRRAGCRWSRGRGDLAVELRRPLDVANRSEHRARSTSSFARLALANDGGVRLGELHRAVERVACDLRDERPGETVVGRVLATDRSPSASCRRSFRRSPTRRAGPASVVPETRPVPSTASVISPSPSSFVSSFLNFTDDQSFSIGDVHLAGATVYFPVNVTAFIGARLGSGVAARRPRSALGVGARAGAPRPLARAHRLLRRDLASSCSREATRAMPSAASHDRPRAVFISPSLPVRARMRRARIRTPYSPSTCTSSPRASSTPPTRRIAGSPMRAAERDDVAWTELRPLARLHLDGAELHAHDDGRVLERPRAWSVAASSRPGIESLLDPGVTLEQTSYHEPPVLGEIGGRARARPTARRAQPRR